MRKVQTVTISITYDDTEFDDPSTWSWDLGIIDGVKTMLANFGPPYRMEEL
jgi:hypothetical protein